MEQFIMKIATREGLFAVMFVGLGIYMLRNSSQREAKYQATIAYITQELGIKITQVQDGVNRLLNQKK